MKKVLLAAIVIVLAVGVGVFVYLDTIAKTGIEQGAGYALGVPTSVNSVRLGLASGDFEVRGLKVDNPKGFESDAFFALDRLRLELPFGRILEDTIRVPLLELDGIDVNIEKGKAGANYDAILQHLKGLQGSSGGPVGEPATQERPGTSKTLIIEQLRIKDVVAHLDIAGLPGGSGKMDVEIPEILLHDISSEDGGGVAISQLTSIVTTAVLQAVMNKGIGLPGDLLGDLRGGLAGLGTLDLDLGGKLPSEGAELLGSVGEQLKGGGGSLGENARQTGEKLKGRLLQGLLGGKKSDSGP